MSSNLIISQVTADFSNLSVTVVKQEKEKEAGIEICTEIFKAFKNSDTVRREILSFFDEPSRFLLRTWSSYVANPLPTFVKLVDAKILAVFLANKNPVYLSKAQYLVQSLYETSTRAIANSANGYEFSMNPELISYLMVQAKNKTVLEIAAASGKNLMLLAYAGAHVAYYNEIEPEENSNFRKMKALLDVEIQGKLQDLSGDCFDVLKKKPNIAGTIDILLCQNLVHFFNTKKQTEFFQLLKKLLKPGGQVVLTANSLYAHKQQGKEIFVKDPQTRAISFVNYVVVNHLLGIAPYKILLQAQFASSPDAVTGFEYENIVIYEKKLTDNSWKKYERNIEKTDVVLRPQIERANKEFEAHDMRLIPAGRVRYVKATHMSFTLPTLTKLLEENGFDVETTFVSKIDGHRIANPAADPFHEGQQMGIIAKYNPKQLNLVIGQ